MNNSKIVMTFEAYKTYSDYVKGGKALATPETMLRDITIAVKHLMPTFDDKWIKEIQDQSDEKKGIKFQIDLVNRDIIHAFKIDTLYNQWEWYLNKKKLSANEIKDILSSKLLDPYDRWEMNFKSFDSYYMYSDDQRAWRSGVEHEKQIIKLYSELSTNNKKKAYKKYTETRGKENPVSFPEFKGV
jgi:hypothetical protein